MYMSKVKFGLKQYPKRTPKLARIVGDISLLLGVFNQVEPLIMQALDASEVFNISPKTRALVTVSFIAVKVITNMFAYFNDNKEKDANDQANN